MTNKKQMIALLMKIVLTIVVAIFLYFVLSSVVTTVFPFGFIITGVALIVVREFSR